MKDVDYPLDKDDVECLKSEAHTVNLEKPSFFENTFYVKFCCKRSKAVKLRERISARIDK